MGKKKPKQIRVAKVAVPEVAKVAKEIKWNFSFQTVPEGHACPRGLDFVVNLKSGKTTAKIPNPWELWVRNPKTQSRYKVEVRKERGYRSNCHGRSQGPSGWLISPCFQGFEGTIKVNDEK